MRWGGLGKFSRAVAGEPATADTNLPKKNGSNALLRTIQNWLVFILAVGFCGTAVHPALAQSTARIFDIEFGTPVGDLPSGQWVEPSCGTDGGPPSIRLNGFDDYDRCPVEPETGLREVWFIYDDEWEYIARAYRDPVEIGRFSANVFFGQPIITSLLIDDSGLVQGYRVITDQGAPDDVRERAHLLLDVFKTTVGDGSWQCEQLQQGERETPVNGVFVKSDCIMVSELTIAMAEARLLRKPGQDYYINPPEGYFEGRARLEVYNTEAVICQTCCREAARR